MSEAATTYQQQAYDFVKAQIMTLKYKPNQYVTDTQVAQELGISRTPVREAFHRLENEGLLLNEARRGWRVYSLSLDDIHEIFDIKEVVEGMIARKAALCTDVLLCDTLQDALQRMVEATAADDSDAWLAADFDLHDALFDMAGNDRAHRIVDNLNDQWHRVRIGFVAMQARMKESTAEHQEFVESILAGNGAQAEQQMRDHLNRVRQELERLLVNVVLPFVDNGV
jgi:DNA-binding GntR family transcriptional regulator